MHAAAPPPQPFFLDTGAAARFCLYHAPLGPCRGAWLFLHPFAEEMNKARRMVALQARALAQCGFAVLQIDLHGCGDSAGDFADATWESWLDDVARGAAWLRERSGHPVALWGLRLGALLALDHLRQGHAPTALLLWQPVLHGGQALTQFLRLKVANQMLTDGGDSGGTTALRQALAAGQPLEIAGYTLAPALALALDNLDGGKLPPPACPIHWFELVADPARPVPPAAARVAESWRQLGANVRSQAVAGPQFWATQEIAECPALLDATIAALTGTVHAA
jgi:exosortase A-associated hydrolase 2